MNLNTKDIDGASPKKITRFGGKKKIDFFKNNQDLNNYYNKIATGSNNN